MKHLSEEQMILYFYGEEETDLPSVEAHLEGCPGCREELESLKGTLSLIETWNIPEPDPDFEERTWQKLRPRLDPRVRAAGPFSNSRFRTWALAASILVLIAVSFLAGIFWPRTPEESLSPALVQRRVLAAAAAEHLEAVQVLMIQLSHPAKSGSTDVSDEQHRARTLLDSNRLYRMSAEQQGDRLTAQVLDELEPVLLQVVHSRSRWSPVDFREFRETLEDQGILFKTHVLEDRLRGQVERTRFARSRKLSLS